MPRKTHGCSESASRMRIPSTTVPRSMSRCHQCCQLASAARARACSLRTNWSAAALAAAGGELAAPLSPSNAGAVPSGSAGPVGLSRRIAKREGVPEPAEAAPATRATRPRPRPREPLPPARPAPPRISPGGRPLGMAGAIPNRRGFRLPPPSHATACHSATAKTRRRLRLLFARDCAPTSRRAHAPPAHRARPSLQGRPP